MVLEFLGSSWVVRHEWALLFYAVLITAIILLRRKIEWQAFGIGLYKTKFGLKLMDKWGTKYRGLVQTLGYIGIGVGFVGMIFITGNLVYGLWVLLTNPAAPAVVSPVLPGIDIPGAALKVPLITGWIALFVVIVIHEFSHGVVSRAHGIAVKSSGLLIFGPIGGAFVEPDEKAMLKQHETVQYSLFAAGPWSNIITALLAVLVVAYAVTPLLGSMTTSVGVSVETVTPNLPAANASLASGTVITAVNGVPIHNYQEMSDQLDPIKAGDVVELSTDKGEYAITTTSNPADASSKKGYLGVTLKTKQDPKNHALWFTALLAVANWISEFFQWFIILSLGLGLANLLPLGPVDGGRMLQTAARKITADNKRGDWWWAKISIFTLILAATLLFVPIIKGIIA
jgi:membrane-associated protease RseP (regulator of RpoE activity)